MMIPPRLFPRPGVSPPVARSLEACSHPIHITTIMKTLVQTLGIMAIASSITFGQEGPENPERKRPSPEKIFKKLDADNDASVTLAEFKAGPRAQQNPEKAEEIFKKIDADNSGGISLEEFKAHRPLRKPGKKGGAVGE